MVKGIVDQTIKIGIAGATYTVRGYAFTWPLPLGSVEASVTVNTTAYKTPFEEEMSGGTRVFKAAWNEQILEEEITISEDVTILFLFDLAGILSRIVVLPTTAVPPLPITELPLLPT